VIGRGACGGRFRDGGKGARERAGLGRAGEQGDTLRFGQGGFVGLGIRVSPGGAWAGGAWAGGRVAIAGVVGVGEIGNLGDFRLPGTQSTTICERHDGQKPLAVLPVISLRMRRQGCRKL
jgi:hypothetical protein